MRVKLGIFACLIVLVIVCCIGSRLDNDSGDRKVDEEHFMSPSTEHISPSIESTTPVVIETSTVSSTYFKSCADARSAGAAPVRIGQPGYRSELDRDGDGVACDK